MFELPHFSQSQRRVVYFALALAIAVGALFFSLSRGNAASTSASSGSAGNSALSSGKGGFPLDTTPTIIAAPVIPATIVVDVAGKVLHPGIYTLPQGSRAADAIKASGGALKGIALTDINLAEILTDGQQLIVGAPVVVTSSSKGKSSKASTGKITSGTIDINTATIAQCEQLPGVGAVMAARIVAYRSAHGNFASVSDLSKVSGMGKSKFTNLKNFVRI